MRQSSKKFLIATIASIAVVIGAGLVCLVMVLNHNTSFSESSNNTFSLEPIDDYSPDREILFYANGQEIEPSTISQVKLEDGLILCDGEPFVVNVFELEDTNTIVITTQDNQTYILTKQ